MAEVTGVATFDLLSPSASPFGTAKGIGGTYRSAQVDLARPASGGAAVELAGNATKGSDAVSFTASLDVTDKVRGIAFSAEITGAPGKVRLQVDLDEWLARVDFAALSGAPGAGPVAVATGTQAHNALVRGVTSTAAYVFSWIAAPR